MSGFFRRLTSVLRSKGHAPSRLRGAGSGRERIRRTYEQFREILTLNESTLQLIADIEDRVSGRVFFSINVMTRRIRQAMIDSFIMVKDLDIVCPGRYDDLFSVVRGISKSIESQLTVSSEHLTGPVLLPLSRLSAGASALVGTKMANLGEIANVLHLNVPDGFAITTSAFARFMESEQLTDKAAKLEEVLDLYGPRVTEEACRNLQNQIIAASLPPEVEVAILEAHARLDPVGEASVAVRSSAVGEDKSASHAGQYYTELNVNRDWLLDAYRQVVASTFGVGPVTYRLQHGLTSDDAAMAVGCIRMVEPRCSGILFSRDFNDPEADRIVISLKRGLNVGITSGRTPAEEHLVALDGPLTLRSCLAGEQDVKQLADAARLLERHFGGPQDIEWAIGSDDRLYILQCRPMVLLSARHRVPTPPLGPDVRPILSGGLTACPGIAAGLVHVMHGEDNLQHVPDGCVLVAPHSSPRFSLIMRKCQAIVTDVGSPVGHMAILAREYGIPTIVSLDNATRELADGTVITVDATNCRIYDGALSPSLLDQGNSAPLKTSPAVLRLKAVAPLIAPLHLIDPHAPDFVATSCRSLHDVARFIHEKVFEAVFYLGSDAAALSTEAPRLGGNLPFDVFVLDVGGGLVEGTKASGDIAQSDIISAPMKAFLGGLTDSRLRWDSPRAISARGFASVVGESIVGPPAIMRGVGRPSFAIVSDRYMNFSTKAGYHFSTVDTYCGKSLNKNYIHFRFEGGAADETRRERRCRFLQTVLTAIKFNVQCRGDVLTGRLEKYDCEYIRARLGDLGRATICCRQLDMLMDKDSSPEYFAQAFLAGDLEKFF